VALEILVVLYQVMLVAQVAAVMVMEQQVVLELLDKVIMVETVLDLQYF
jgi:hypothetical protein